MRGTGADTTKSFFSSFPPEPKPQKELKSRIIANYLFFSLSDEEKTEEIFHQNVVDHLVQVNKHVYTLFLTAKSFNAHVGISLFCLSGDSQKSERRETGWGEAGGTRIPELLAQRQIYGGPSGLQGLGVSRGVRG